jgi:hypothetical protein
MSMPAPARARRDRGPAAAGQQPAAEPDAVHRQPVRQTGVPGGGAGLRARRAKELVDSALELTPDDSHALSEAVDIYHALKDDAHVNELMGRLQQADQEQYLIKRFMLQRGL